MSSALYFTVFSRSRWIGHRFGQNLRTEKSVQLVDNAIGNLWKKVNQLGFENVNFIFVSDHGMIKVDKENPLSIPEMLLNKERFDIYNSQTLLRVVVKT